VDKIQMKRWTETSKGMAKNLFPTITEARRKRLIIEVEDFIDYVCSFYPLQDIQDWDGNLGSVYVCDELDDYLYRNGFRHFNNRFDPYHKSKVEVERETRFANLISCCVRAGFDLAVKQSGGVLGFSVGDFRQIFNGEVPDWARWSGKEYSEGPYSEDIPDECPIWL
jgi:hypothetical protein